jgi:DNA-binding transcriptional ArsR family regulator
MAAVDDLDHGRTVLWALGDTTRQRIFELLIERGSGTATVLAPEFGISRQAVAKHLTQLAEAGLATSERVGRETVYQPSPSGLDDLVAWADQARALWNRRLDRLA